jgi:hypothetical protein
MLLAVLLLVGEPATAQSNVTNFTNVRTTGYLRADSLLRADEFVRVTPRTVITVTGVVTDAAVTPTGTYQRLDSNKIITVTSIATSTAGTLLILTNVAVTATINITDGTPHRLGGDRGLGPNDTLMLLSDGTEWNELSFTNN